MVRVRVGDIDLLGTLFERHHRALFNFFLRMTGDRQASEDLVQEAFIRMLRYRRSFGARGHFRGWMYRLARNLCIDHLRRGSDEATDPAGDILIRKAR